MSNPLRRRRRVVHDPVADMALLAAYLLLAGLVLLWAYLQRDLAAVRAGKELLLALLPNFAAIVIAFILAATLLERRGLSPEQRLRRSIVHDVVAAAKPVPGVRALYPLIQTTPYGDVFRESDRLEFVGRWYNETLARHPLELVEFLDGGGHLTVVIMDPEDEPLLRLAAQQYLGSLEPSEGELATVRQKTVETIVTLERLCASRPGSYGGQVHIHVTRMPLNAWGIRSVSPTSGDLLYFAPYDHVRGTTSSCPTVVFDLGQSGGTKDFWVRDVTGLISRGQTLAEWRQSLAQRLVASGGIDRPRCGSIALAGADVRDALQRAGLSREITSPTRGLERWVGLEEAWSLQFTSNDAVDGVTVQPLSSHS